ncbi:MAG: phosphonopyruvate decarboxylase [Candidatus Marinimicrobia bacterium]|nr:phosphonopyruvate decarboxylase [Candidatus Neomarinimicrobiota bacterium]
MGISPVDFYSCLADHNVIFFTGVPDSLLKEFCLCVDDKVPKERHVITANEGNAVAMAAGYHLGTGKLPLVYMQNSGLGNAVNPLLSLCDPDVYSIPMLIMIGWRGEPGFPDEPQHVKQGKIQLELLETMDIPYVVISKDERNIKQKITTGIEQTIKENRPFVFLIKRGTFEKYRIPEPIIDNSLMTREESLETILSQLPNDCIIVSTTGLTSREIFEIREKNREPHFRDFLTVGSMGHCSSIAHGISIAQPNRQVICIDGDGSLIMHMGSLSTVGKLKPPNFFHVLINNYVHESVGGQETSAKFIDMVNLVKSNGYRSVFSVEDGSRLKSQLEDFLKSNGPCFLEIRVRPGSRNDLGRPTVKPVDNKIAFMDFLKE